MSAVKAGDSLCCLRQTDEMEIRKLNESDAEAWWRLRLEAVETEPLAFGQTIEEHRALPLSEIAERLRETEGGSFTLGAFEGDRLLASAVFLREGAIKERHKGHLRRVYVSAAHRGQGLGAKLIGALLDLAGADPTLEQVMLAVGAHNSAAMRTYARFGFESYGIELHALKVGPEYEDEHLMVLWIDAARRKNN